MQKLVWQNKNGETVDLTSASNGGHYGITEWEGFSNAGLNVQSQQVPFQDGAVFLDALIEPRELSVTLAMQDNNNLELRYQLRRELIHILNPKLGEGYLIYTNDFTSKRIKCIPQIPLFQNKNSNDSGTPKASLAWTACEPYWEDLEETVVELEAGETVQIENEGDVPAQVKMEISGESSESTIINSSTSKQIGFKGNYVDNIFISTMLGDKKAEIVKSNVMWNQGGEFKAVAYGNGKRIFVGSLILVQDITTGTEVIVEIELDGTLNDIIYDGTRFIIVGENAGYISYDGKVFTRNDNLKGVKIILNDGVYAKCYAISDLAWFDYSQDLETWTRGSTMQELGGVGGFIYSSQHQKYIFTGISILGLHPVLKTSTDLSSWSSPSIGITGNICVTDVCVNGSDVYAVCDNGTILYSSDLTTWTNSASGVTTRLNTICHYKNMFVIGGDEGVVLIKNDFDSAWTSIQSNIVNNIKKYSTVLGELYAVGNGGLIAKCNNITQWRIEKQSNKNTINDMIHDNNLFIVVGDNGYIATSSNFKDWNVKQSGTSENLQSIIKGNGIYVVVGNNGTILMSGDLSYWKTETSGISTDLTCVVYGNDLFIASGSGGTVKSEDGEYWEIISDTSGYEKGTFANGYFVFAKGSSGVLTAGFYTKITEDGETWINKGSMNTYWYSSTSKPFVSCVKVIGDNIYIIAFVDDLDGYIRKMGYCLVLKSDFSVFKSFVFRTGTTLTQDSYIVLKTITNSKSINYIFGEGYCYKGVSDFTRISFPIVGALNASITVDDKIYVAGVDGVLGSTHESNTENIISDLTSQSDMTFDLKQGNNNITYYDDIGQASLFISYRQKYIGV